MYVARKPICFVCSTCHAQQLIASFSATDYNINVGVLQTAHSIFQQWRAHVRSDELFTEINFVLSKFMDPFMQLFRQTASLLLTKPSPNPALTTPKEKYALLAQVMVLLVDIYYDFTCQDLPPAIEDSHEEFFGPGSGWFQAFLLWEPVELRGDVRDIPIPFFSLFAHHLPSARRHYPFFDISDQNGNFGDFRG